MKYRNFQAGNTKLSLLGFGTMRLPLNPDETIDEPRAINLIRSGIDRGINYIDTAYMYHKGKSEALVGKALKDGYREKVFLADKFPVWASKGKHDNRRVFDKQMTRLDTEYIDLYLLHSLDKDHWKLILEYDVIPFLEGLKEEGKIKYIGFSYHDELPLFKEIIDYYPWDFCQIQLNYMDKNFQAGVEGLKYAGSKNIPVVIMEPLKGGKLTAKVPPSIKELWDNAHTAKTPAAWGFSWLGNFDQVMTILSGMSTEEQLDENLKTFETIEANSLSMEDIALIDKVSAKYNELIKYSCTGCQYCLPCPSGLNIPKLIDLLNDFYIYEGSDKTIDDYNMRTGGEVLPEACISCHKCEEICPQSLNISNIMNECHTVFSEKK
ncbi:MAG: aldo/keto reductase [Anaerovoracaceae bacterium]